jgi:hypothetical protein
MKNSMKVVCAFALILGTSTALAQALPPVKAGIMEPLYMTCTGQYLLPITFMPRYMTYPVYPSNLTGQVTIDFVRNTFSAPLAAPEAGDIPITLYTDTYIKFIKDDRNGTGYILYGVISRLNGNLSISWFIPAEWEKHNRNQPNDPPIAAGWLNGTCAPAQKLF